LLFFRKRKHFLLSDCISISSFKLILCVRIYSVPSVFLHTFLSIHHSEDNDKEKWKIWDRNEEEEEEEEGGGGGGGGGEEEEEGGGGGEEEEEEDGGNTVRTHERNGDGENREGV